MTEFELLMQQSGWSVAEAAKVLGYSEGHVYRWKRGDEVPELVAELGGDQKPGAEGGICQPAAPSPTFCVRCQAGIGRSRMTAAAAGSLRYVQGRTKCFGRRAGEGGSKTR